MIGLPDESLRCLLVQPKFSTVNFWNYVEFCELMGARAIQPPLGLLTAAALLPRAWQVRVVDLNVRPLSEADWAWAQVVGTGGMLPQQKGMLEVIRRARAEGKFVVVGGPDPTSQPAIYAQADALVLGEGEVTIPLWLASWRRGEPRGRFESAERPDIATAPVPRYELIDLNDYLHVGVQYSRGCPFNCEFCDIIELYGRTPRTKTTEQFLGELSRLYELGHRGWVDIVDDNFIGNKRNIKRMLPELEAWSRARGYPFFFSTEASMNLADDEPLLAMMQAVDFRFVFMGIETPDPRLLAAMQKPQNVTRPMSPRIRRVYEHGMAVAAGFILGFDDEPAGSDRAIIDCIETNSVVFALVSLLIACPHTQLAERLAREGRLQTLDGRLAGSGGEGYCTDAELLAGEHIDTSSAGLNFVATRPKSEILAEFASVIGSVYSPRSYFDRARETASWLRVLRRHRPSGRELGRGLRAAWRMAWRYSRQRETRWLFWRNVLHAARRGLGTLEFALIAMGVYLHFQQQTGRLLEEIAERRDRELAVEARERVAAASVAGRTG